MRRFFIPCMMILFMAGACTVQESEKLCQYENHQKLVFTAESGEVQTKTAFQADETSIWWSPSDQICIFYGNSEGSRFTATNATEEVAKAEFRGILNAFTGEAETGEACNFWAIYPYSLAVSCDGSSVVAKLSDRQVAKAGSFAPNTNISIAKSTGLNLSFFNACSWFRFSLMKEGVKYVTLKGNNSEDVAGKFRISMDNNGRPTAPEVIEGVKSIILTPPNGEAFEVGQMYYITLLPQVFNNGFTVSFETDTELGSRSITSKATFLRSKYNTGVEFDKVIEWTYVGGVKAVDLGLSVKWASVNLGANSPEETGDFLAWGELEPKLNYDWSTYKWCMGTEKSLIKYNSSNTYGVVDNKTAYDSSDDAASVRLGDYWRTPTSVEVKELIDGCTWKKTTLNGVVGYLGISEATDCSIFFPLTGVFRGASISEIGETAVYWTSEVHSPANQAHSFYFMSSKYSSDGNDERRYGYCVRPVCDREPGEYISVSKIKIPSTLQLYTSQTTTITATILPKLAQGDKTLSWSSSNPSVAGVTQTGMVVGVSEGSAEITAECQGVYANCEVTVTPMINVTGVSLDYHYTRMPPGDMRVYGVTVSPNNASNKKVKWYTSNSNVVEIESSTDNQVRIRAKNYGSANITVKTEDGNYTDECHVVVVSE